jgi:hypothetical protein
MFGTVAGALIFGVLPHFTGFPLFPIIVMFLGVLLVFGMTRFLRQYDWKQANDLHRFGLAAGALTPLIVFTPLQELDQTRTDNSMGMGLVGLAFLIGLVWLGWQIRKRTQAMRKTDGDHNRSRCRLFYFVSHSLTPHHFTRLS